MIDHAAARRHLGRVDPKMRQLVRELAPCTFERARGMSPYQSLVRAVAHQQLHAMAAERILARLTALTPGPLFPGPEELLALPEGALRGAGFSTAKALALRDIAAKTLEGVVPAARTLARLDDEAIIQRLTAVRGVGRWTAEILLIRLGRPDVLPADDFGLRTGFRATYGGRELPSPLKLRAFGERWRPYRTVACWYLWRAADKKTAKTPRTPRPVKATGRA